MVFLGVPRRPLTTAPHEAGWWMRMPMGMLAGVCLLIGLAPVVMAPLLEAAIVSWMPPASNPVSLHAVALSA